MVYVKYNNVCVCDERSDEDYGDWHQEFEFSVQGVYLVQPNGSVDSFNVPFERGETCYVVHYTYSDGDSFGYSDGNGEIAMVYRHYENAQFAKGVIKKTSGDSLKMHIPFEKTDGSIEIAQLGNPMFDYFTNLQDVYIDTFIVQ